MHQKKVPSNLAIIILMLAFFQCAFAEKIVDFNANLIASPLSASNGFNLDLSIPSFDANLSNGYLGPAIYSSYKETVGGKSIWSAHTPNNSGLKLRWNPSMGITGDFASALFLFKKDEFLNGFSQETVEMDATNDSISLKTGYLNLGSAQGGSPIERATVRIVLKDNLGYFISVPIAVGSSQTLSIEATELIFFTYDPFNQSGHEAGSIGNRTIPNFSNVESIGFRLDAIRGENTALGVNFGVTEFSANARGPSADINLDLDIATRHQQIEGFGAAGAWYESLLNNHNDKATVMDLLFKDLSLDIYRLRNVYNHNNLNYQNKIAQDAAIISSAESSLGRPLKIFLSAWSPPAYLKSNSDTRNGGTLAKDSNGEYRYNDYAQWWNSSLLYYASSGINIVPDYISMQNEPNWAAEHESNILAVAESATEAAYDTAFEAVWNKLNNNMGGSMPKMVGPETVGLRVADQYINSLTNPEHMYGYAHHLYQQDVGANPDVLLDDMADFQSNYNDKPIFQTEYFNNDSATPWLRSYNLAKLMHNSLTVEGVSAYFYWGLYWNGEQGLIDLPDRNSYSITPEYYAFKHYSGFVNSGWQRFKAQSSLPGIHTSAYVNPDNSSVSIIILSELTEQVGFLPTLEGYTINSIQAYRTTQTENFSDLGSLDLTSEVLIEPNSITTLSLSIAESNQAPEITILTPNEAAVLSGHGLILDAQVSDDAYPNTSAPSTSWTSLDTPTGGSAIFDSQSSLQTGVTFDVPGSYQLQLSASDGARTATESILVHYNATNSINNYTSQDIGSVGLAGSSVEGNNSVTISGSGSDIWGSADAFQFHYKTLGQDGSLVARLTSQGNSNSWAKSGLMIRDSLEPNSSYAYIAKTPGNGTVFQYRTQAGENSLTQNVNQQALPLWLKIERSGTNITAYTSTTGSNWQNAGTISPAMTDLNYIGFATTSHNNSALSEAVFDNILNNISNIGPEISTGTITSATIDTATPLNASVIDDGQPNNTAPSVNWTQLQGPGLVNWGSANSIQTTFSGDTIGTYSLRLIADDSAIKTFNTLNLSVHSAWKGWQIAYFGDPNSSSADALADPNNNGLQNIFEFALGGHPTNEGNSADILPVYGLIDNSNESFLSLTYRRRTGSGSGNAVSGYTIDGITYYVEASNSLSNINWLSNSNELIQVGSPLYNGDGTESVTVRMQEPIDSTANTRAFMRLKVQSSE